MLGGGPAIFPVTEGLDAAARHCDAAGTCLMESKGTASKLADTSKLLTHLLMLFFKVSWLQELTSHQLDE